MARTAASLVVVVLGGLGLLFAGPPLDVDTPKPVAVAPPPRDADETRSFTRAALEARTEGTKSEGDFGVITWRVEAGVRRLASTKKDVIELHWGIRYNGPRPPLHVQRPSLTSGWPESTVALVSAIPQGKERGRDVKFMYTDDKFPYARHRAEGSPIEWYILEKGGEWATGTETISVTELKGILQSGYPGEFPPGCPPPSLYVSLLHHATQRGGELDCWTGDLIADSVSVPELSDW
ncbi:MAG: hypothetical protein K2X82_32760 [Gemmataceae bacterium]|nr:hypothetical protein [Gemmataceae bacterium]